MNAQTSPKVVDGIELAKWVAKELPIHFIGDRMLSTICESYTPEEIASKEARETAELLLTTLRKYRKKAGTGRGLAANQVGVLKRMIVVWLDDDPFICINPEAIHLEGSGSYWESCISAGSLVIGEVIRPWKGTFKYLDLQGNEQILKADEKQTRLFLHEIDHLNGEVCLHKYEPRTLRFVQGGKEEVLGYSFKELS